MVSAETELKQALGTSIIDAEELSIKVGIARAYKAPKRYQSNQERPSIAEATDALQLLYSASESLLSVAIASPILI